MKKRFSVRTIILAGSLLLQLSTLCFHSRGAAGDVDLSFDPGSGVNGTVNAVVVQPDGKVIIGGQFTTVKGLTRVNVARLNADGSGDSSFTPAPLNYPVYTLTLQPDGKVLVGSFQDNFGLTRLNSDGSPDTNFNANAGLAIAGTEPYYSFRISTIVVQPDGRVLYPGETLLRLNSDGTLDTNFHSAAIVIAYSMARQPDGKLIVGGYFYTDYVGGTAIGYGLARLNANGSLDNSFDTGAAADGFYNSIVLQPDGKVLFGGLLTRVNGTNYTPIARLNANGSVDATFGLVSGSSAGGLQTRANAIALQPDGKVIIGGQFISINGHSRTNLARLNADGSLDNSYNPGTGANGEVRSIASQADGKVLIGGHFTTVNGTNRNRMARLNADGTLDVTFQPGRGVDGAVSSLVVQPDGKVLIGGALTFINGTNRYGRVRLNADGSFDSTFISGTNFHPDLTALTPYDDCPGDPRYRCEKVTAPIVVRPQADGKVLIGGYVETTVSGEEVFVGYSRAILGRFHADGSLDTSFRAVIGYASPYDSPQSVGALAVQPDGKILVGGKFDSINGTNRNGMARLNADGTLDTSFITGAGPYASVGSLVLQPDGKILVSGSFGVVNGSNYSGMARLNANGSLDSSFNPGTGANGVGSLALQPDGKIVLAGYFSSINGTNGYGIARFHTNGSLDNTFNPRTAGGGFVGPIALQSDGKVLIGGDFLTVDGVLRPHVARLYGDSLAPSLSIARSNAFVIVSWPVTGSNFQLQENTNLSLPNSWSPVAQPAVTNAGQISVTVPTTVGREFFRLKSQ